MASDTTRSYAKRFVKTRLPNTLQQRQDKNRLDAITLDQTNKDMT